MRIPDRWKTQKRWMTAVTRGAHRAVALRRVRSGMQRHLSTLRGAPVCFYGNPGNAGDALIRVGTLDAFAEAELRWDEVRPGDDVSGRTVLLGGGGNLTPLYDQMATALQRFLETDPARIIILPHGIRGHADSLSTLRPVDTIFCRDQLAFDFVSATGTPATIALEHDMAFHLGVDAFLSRWEQDPDARTFLDERLAAHGWSLERIADQPTMRFMRRDAERRPDAPPGDLDISFHLIHGDVDSISPIAAWSLLRCIAASRSIVTDRLHVAIGAAMVGIPLHFYPNSYDKNESVYRTSLSRFPDVTWAGDARP